MDQIDKITLSDDGQFLFVIPALTDNYIYLLSWESKALIVDPGEGKKAFSLLEQEKLTLTNVLITHYHEDHTGGNEYLKKKTACHIIGPEDNRIPSLEQSIADGEELLFGPFSIEVIATPGHTKPHVVYFFRNLKLLFCGDLLFGGGCGRLFEGTPKEMWESLQKICLLPDDTQIFFGHEYTLKNIEFAQHIQPKNEAITMRLEEVKRKREAGQITTPTTLGLEKKTNPYLLADKESMKEALAMPKASPIEVFAHLRKLKDQWTG